MKKYISLFFGLVFLVALGWSIYWVVGTIWGQFRQLDTKISVALLTAATTVIVSTLTVVLGKYYERKKDIEAHYREKKTEIYDEFLKEFFDLFHNEEESEKKEQDMVAFLREWQRKMILWGGQDVLAKYVSWMGKLKQGEPDAQTMFMTEEFFLEIRKDLGHRNNKLTKGTFIHLILQNPELFLSMAKENPNITLAELSEVEKKLQS